MDDLVIKIDKDIKTDFIVLTVEVPISALIRHKSFLMPYSQTQSEKVGIGILSDTVLDVLSASWRRDEQKGG